MGSMTAIASRRSTRFTRADLEAMPDDGRRYELLDGAIVVTPPSPMAAHQILVLRLAQLLDDHVSDGLRVMIAPFDVALPTGDVLQPDLLVTRESELTDKDVTGVPLLTVEVVSPSSRRRDCGDKLTAYRDAGVPSYWVVDPEGPRLQVWELRDGDYVQLADVSGDEQWTADAPYAVTVVPRALLR